MTTRRGSGRPPPLRMALTGSGDHAVDLRWTARRLVSEAAAATMLDELARAGVPAVLLKGPVTARRLYPGELRPCVDCDVLVPPGSAAAARRWLRRHGFHARPDDPWVFRRQADGATIDLHPTLRETSATPEQVWRVLASHTVTFPLHGRQVLALDHAAHACHLAIHAVQSGNRRPRPRLDLDRAVARLPAGTWAGALTVARQLGAEPALVAALRCYAAGGGRVADELGLPPAPFLARLCAADASGAAEMLRQLRAMSWRRRARQLRRWIAPRPAEAAARLARPDTPAWLPGRLPWWLGLVALRGHQAAAVARAAAAARRSGAGRRARPGG